MGQTDRQTDGRTDGRAKPAAAMGPIITATQLYTSRSFVE